jgi:hypothetical protein
MQCVERRDGHNITTEERSDFDIILREFDEYIHELKMCMERSKVLEIKAKTTTQLVSYLSDIYFGNVLLIR